MFDDVLVPTDGSDCAALAAEYAADLAEHYDATLHALTVADSRSRPTAGGSGSATDASDSAAERVRDELDGAASPDDVAVRTGVPHEEILDYAAAEGVDLVVMGTHGRTGARRVLLGSVTEKVLRSADVPVLTVRPSDDGGVRYPYEDVLVPTDGSEPAEAAIDVGVDVAGRYGARLHAVSVVDTMSLGVDVRSGTVADALDDNAESAVSTVAQRADEAGVSPVETGVVYGQPVRELRSYVDDNEVDLVVMGTHGRGGVERYLLGSVTEKLVRTSSAPVTTVRQADPGA